MGKRHSFALLMNHTIELALDRLDRESATPLAPNIREGDGRKPEGAVLEKALFWPWGPFFYPVAVPLRRLGCWG